jgi:hypothetical protein
MLPMYDEQLLLYMKQSIFFHDLRDVSVIKVIHIDLNTTRVPSALDSGYKKIM